MLAFLLLSLLIPPIVATRSQATAAPAPPTLTSPELRVQVAAHRTWRCPRPPPHHSNMAVVRGTEREAWCSSAERLVIVRGLAELDTR